MPCIYIYTRYHIYIYAIYIFSNQEILFFAWAPIQPSHLNWPPSLQFSDSICLTTEELWEQQTTVLYIWAVLRSVPYFLGGVPKGGGRLTSHESLKRSFWYVWYFLVLKLWCFIVFLHLRGFERPRMIPKKKNRFTKALNSSSSKPFWWFLQYMMPILVIYLLPTRGQLQSKIYVTFRATPTQATSGSPDKAA